VAISLFVQELCVNKKQEKNQSISDLETNSRTELENEAASDPSAQTSEANETERALAAKTEEAQTLHDKYLRLAAEFDNYKRLAQRDQREHAKFANENILKELLPVVDNLERAIGFAKGGSGSDGLIQGVELTHKQFIETLGKFGVRPINSMGEMFDPSRHQAVAHVPSPGAAGNTVVEEYQKGYQLHDRVLRPAMVAVAAPSESSGMPNESPHASY
jgi:molecular chaperone GrpE